MTNLDHLLMKVGIKDQTEDTLSNYTRMKKELTKEVKLHLLNITQSNNIFIIKREIRRLVQILLIALSLQAEKKSLNNFNKMNSEIRLSNQSFVPCLSKIFNSSNNSS
jgi:hypothetical protein